MKAKAIPGREAALSVPVEALCGVIAHELNNMAVPLRGFIDLALQTASTGESARQSLDEIYVGLDRIVALAYQLESLAQQSSTPAKATIGACFAFRDHGFLQVPPPLVWSCNQLTVVNADVDHVRRAITALVHLAGPGSLFVAETAMDGQACAVCGKAFARGRIVVEVEAHGLRPAIFAAIRAPFEAAQKLRTTQRLAIAALAHCAHLAGGHVAANLEGKSLGIVLSQ